MLETIPSRQFAEIFCLNPKQFSWFLGAGASASAGIPTGYAMIQDFRKRLYCQLASVSSREVDTNDPLWIERINLFLRNRSTLPPPGDPTEYAATFEAIYSTPQSRRAYIEQMIKNGTPSYGHRVFGSIITCNYVPCIFTTNFDPLIENATTVTDHFMPASKRANLTVAAIDNPDRAELCLSESNWPLLAKLHGDFHSVQLKNTNEELREQDTKMRQILISSCLRFGLIVAGYSGRDSSIMEALTEVITKTNAYPGGVYWITQSKDLMLPTVYDFLEKAAEANIKTTIVESPTFDELAGDIFERIELPEILINHVNESRPTPILTEVPLSNQENRKFPVLQCSAIPVLLMPKVARRIAVRESVTTPQVRKFLRESRVRGIAVSNGKEIAAFGADDELTKAFSPLGCRIDGVINLYPDRDSWARGIIYDALTRAVCRGKPILPRLRGKGHYVRVAGDLPNDSPERSAWRKKHLADLQSAYLTTLFGTVPTHGFPFSESIRLRLDLMAGNWWCVFEPFTDVELPNTKYENNQFEDKIAVDEAISWRNNPVIDWQRERWARRYNTAWSKIISAWANILSGENGDSVYALGVDEASGIDAEFILSPITAWCRPSHEHNYFLRGER